MCTTVYTPLFLFVVSHACMYVWCVNVWLGAFFACVRACELIFCRQALMELGATVCTAKSPDCSACPVRASCLAHKLTAAGPRGLDGLKPEAASTGGSDSITGAKALKTRTAFPPPSSSSSSTSFQGKAPASSTSTTSTKCGCAVCEVGEDGTAALPAAVTDFPRKAAKT